MWKLSLFKQSSFIAYGYFILLEKTVVYIINKTIHVCLEIQHQIYFSFAGHTREISRISRSTPEINLVFPRTMNYSLFIIFRIWTISWIYMYLFQSLETFARSLVDRLKSSFAFGNSSFNFLFLSSTIDWSSCCLRSANVITPPARRAWRSYKFASNRFSGFFPVTSWATAHGWYRCALLSEPKSPQFLNS